MIEKLVVLLALWPSIAILVWFLVRRYRGGFMAIAYIVNMFIVYWFGAAAHALPWSPFMSSERTITGFEASTVALALFALGLFLVLSRTRPSTAKVTNVSRSLNYGRHLSTVLLRIGLASWLVATTGILQSLPSGAAVLSAGKQCLILAVCVKCWLFWHSGARGKAIGWLAIPCALPAVTMLGEGFLGFGIVALVTAFCFVGTFYRPAWHLPLLGATCIYAGLSLFVSYFQYRDALRDTVWGGAGIEARLQAAAEMLSTVHPFDPYDSRSLEVLDARFNQSELVGAALMYTPHYQPFAYGTTMVDAVLALIPRVVWPDKPVIAGSGDYVSRYTGVIFAQGTSVGMGQVFEFYINFGYMGIAIGSFLFGLAIGYVERRHAEALMLMDWQAVATWFLVGSGMLQVQGALSEITGTAATGALVASCVARVVRQPVTQR